MWRGSLTCFSKIGLGMMRVWEEGDLPQIGPSDALVSRLLKGVPNEPEPSPESHNEWTENRGQAGATYHMSQSCSPRHECRSVCLQDVCNFGE
jgi:hypothetical protein